MGTITKDMSRLHDEIGASRIARKACLDGLRNAVEGLRDGVENMLSDFHVIRTKTMKRAKAYRRAFVSDLQDKVLSLRNDVADFRRAAAADINGARAAFFGHAGTRRAPSSRKPTAKKSRSRNQ